MQPDDQIKILFSMDNDYWENEKLGQYHNINYQLVMTWVALTHACDGYIF